ncbi:MAG: hypothetical protein LBN34_03470 [Clostridiales Family XIII bacterium]|jgi:hypothetical protein|nr:hypothetical protein [Clostridiales Family XIII bacterium]
MTKQDAIDFAPSLWLLLPTLISEIAKAKETNFIEAMRLVYTSKLFEDLSNEELKVWHFSERLLASLLLKELDGKSFRYPEVV